MVLVKFINFLYKLNHWGNLMCDNLCIEVLILNVEWPWNWPWTQLSSNWPKQDGFPSGRLFSDCMGTDTQLQQTGLAPLNLQGIQSAYDKRESVHKLEFENVIHIWAHIVCGFDYSIKINHLRGKAYPFFCPDIHKSCF